MRSSRRNLALGLGVVLGYALWLTWAYVLEKGPPLDGGARYLGMLFVAGAILAAVEPADPWPGPVGLYLGQAMALAGEAFLGFGGDPYLVPLRLLYLVSITLSAALGAAVFAGARIWLHRP
jgi:hypothetical protein